MKNVLTVLALTIAPAVAFAWAPYETSTATQNDAHMTEAQTVAAYDPAVVPLDYYDANETEESTAQPLTLDAD